MGPRGLMGPSCRDTRIMGAEKMDLQKRGAAHCFFHFLAPIFFLISWAPRPLCAHRFFRFLVPINTFETPIKINEKLWAGRPLCAHRFFQIKPPINFFEKSWAHAHRAPMSFFISAHDPRIPIKNTVLSCLFLKFIINTPYSHVKKRQFS